MLPVKKTYKWPADYAFQSTFQGIKTRRYKVGHNGTPAENKDVLKRLCEPDEPLKNLCVSLDDKRFSTIKNGPLSDDIMTT